MAEDAAVWERVLELAARGRWSVSPNPMVGAVLVAPDGSVVGEGSHGRAGGPHAEAEALVAAGERARGSTLYVNLEPCAHHGRTPPCADALVAAGVARVVASLRDPDPRTSGRGFARLREAGVEVVEGPSRERAEELNEVFLLSVRQRRPFVHLKWAMTADGKTASATGASRWITGPEAREAALALREETDAILVGAGTVLADDPRLTRRLGRNGSILPHRRVVLDGRLRCAPSARVFDPALPGEAWVVTAREEGDPALAPFRERGVRVVALPGERGLVDVGALLGFLAGLEVRSVLVEGGGETAWGFLASGLADRVTVFLAPSVLGGQRAATPVGGEGIARPDAALRLEAVTVDRVGADVRLSGRLARLPGGAAA